jgi:DNA repair ATPase RecN
MSSGAFKVLSEILPNFKSSISEMQTVRNKYHKEIHNLKQSNEAYTYDRSDMPEIENLSDNLQQKHHSVMKKIENEGRRNDYSYRLNDSKSEEVIEDLEDLISDINSEIKSIRLKRGGFISVIVLAIIAPVILSVI